MFQDFAHTVRVSDPSDAKDALEAADTLGLEVAHVKVRGAWDYDEDVGIASHAKCQVESIGRKWFYLEVSGAVVKCKPGYSRVEHLDAGELEIRFD